MTDLVMSPGALQGGSNHGALGATTNGTGQLIAANANRNGLRITVDPATAATTPILYLLLASSGTASASNFDVAVSPTLPRNGAVGPADSVYAVPSNANGSGRPRRRWR